MKQTVYVDILLFLNLIVTFLLLKSASLLSGVCTNRKRLFLGTLIGGTASLLIFVQMNSIESLVTKLVLGFTLSWIVFFKRKSPRLFWRAFFSFLLVNFIFAGFMTAVFLLFPARGMVYRNGVVYFHMSAITLTLLSGAAYVIIRLVCRIIQRRTDAKQTVCVHIESGGCHATLTALVDTGNRLNDPFSGLPVMIATKTALSPLLPAQWFSFVETLARQQQPFYKGEAHPAYRSFRMIPVSTVAGQSVLPAFCPDRIEISGEEKRAVIAVLDAPLSNGSYDAVIGPSLIP